MFHYLYENPLNRVSQLLFVVWLLICTIQDIKEKKVSLLIISTGFIILFPISLIAHMSSIHNRIGGLILGLFLIFLTYITKEKIGLGDGLLITVIGICFGLGFSSGILTYALFFSALVSLLLIFLKKGGRNTRMPFIPFLLIGYLGVLLI